MATALARLGAFVAVFLPLSLSLFAIQEAVKTLSPFLLLPPILHAETTILVGAFLEEGAY